MDNGVRRRKGRQSESSKLVCADARIRLGSHGGKPLPRDRGTELTEPKMHLNYERPAARNYSVHTPNKTTINVPGELELG